MKHTQNKRTLHSLLSLCMAILLFVCVIPFAPAAVAATEPNYYTATGVSSTFTIYSGDTAGVTVSEEGNSAALTPGVPSAHMTGTLAADKNFLRIEVGNFAVASNQSILFYLEGGTSAVNLRLAWGTTRSNLNYVNSGASYYVMDMATKTWTPAQASGDRIPISAGFRGWIRIPFASFGTTHTGNFKFMRLQFVGGYTFSIGGVMVVNETNDNRNFVLANNGLGSLIPQSEYTGTLLEKNEATPGLKDMAAEGSTNAPDSGIYYNQVNGTAPLNYAGADKFHFYRPDGAREDFDFSGVLTDIVPNLQVYFKSVPDVVRSNHSLLLYASTDSKVDTYFSLRLYNGYLSCGSEYEGLTYYLRDDTEDEWKVATTVDPADMDKVENNAQTTSYYGDIKLPAGFRGWIRIPVSAFRSSYGRTPLAAYRKDANSTGYVYVFPRTLGGNYGTLTVGSFMLLEQNALVDDCTTLNFNDGNGAAQTIDMTGKIIEAPVDVTMDQVYFNGSETDVTVSVDNIKAYPGCKLYYQINGVDVLLEREGHAYYSSSFDANNVKNFRLPVAPAADGRIVADAATETRQDNISALGISLWHENGDDYTYENGGKEYFKLLFACRAAREFTEGDTTYTLKGMAVKVTSESGNSKEYYIEKYVFDICPDYVDFTKEIPGTYATKANTKYTFNAIGIYGAAGKDDIRLESATSMARSFNDLLADETAVS